MKRTWKPTTAGILTIIGGILGIGIGAFVATLHETGGALMGLAGFCLIIGAWLIPLFMAIVGDIAAAATGFGGIIGAPVISMGVIALIGGVYAMRRKVWRFALAGAILAIICGGIFGILATIFVSRGRREFA